MRQSSWLRVSHAAEILGCSEDSVRRMVASGRLVATDDPQTLSQSARARGRPPRLLVSRESVERALAKQAVGSISGRAGARDALERIRALQAEVSALEAQLASDATLTRIQMLETENARLRAELAKAREAARLSLIIEDHQADAERIRREQLRQFLQPDFVDE